MKTKKYLFAVLAIVMIIATVFTSRVNAADPTTGSLTIICHEQKS